MLISHSTNHAVRSLRTTIQHNIRGRAIVLYKGQDSFSAQTLSQLLRTVFKSQKEKKYHCHQKYLSTNGFNLTIWYTLYKVH